MAHLSELLLNIIAEERCRFLHVLLQWCVRLHLQQLIKFNHALAAILLVGNFAKNACQLGARRATCLHTRYEQE